jgi:hypothetical protein
MRIDLTRSRRGEIGMEAMLILPVAIIIVLLARLILEGMLVRQEVGVFTRSGTAAAAVAESTLPIFCTSDRDPFSERPAVNQTAFIICQERRAEGGLQTQNAFWPAVRQGSNPYPRMMRDVYQDEDLMDYAGDGTGTTTFSRPEYLSRIGLMTTSGAALFPGMELWTHADEPLRSAHDPVLWDALREQGTWRLFPEVFPAREGG